MSRSLTLEVVVVVALGMVLSSVAVHGVGGMTSREPAGLASPDAGSSVDVASTLHHAIESLSHGEGPAKNVPLHCQVSSRDGATCAGVGGTGSAPPTGAAHVSGATHASAVSGTSRGAVPRGGASPPGVSPAPSSRTPGVTLTGPNWYNVTGNISFDSSVGFGTALPTNVGGSELAYDPLLDSVVMWVGCAVSVCPDAETWTYAGLGWQNLTGSLIPAPSPRSFPSMDYDPALQAVVLVGGFDPLGAGLNDTWSFNGAWTNITSTAGPLSDAGGILPIAGGVGGDPMTWDPALGGLVMADGCSTSGCGGNIWSVTWLLNSTGWHALGFGPGFASATWLGYGSMAYDPTDGYLVFFGGYDVRAFSTENWTYTYTLATGWVNVSANDSACFFIICTGTPQGRDGAGLTWDAQLGAVLLVDGWNSSSGVFYNDSWTFVGGIWFPTPLAYALAPSSFLATWAPALAPNSTGITPFLVGGDTNGFSASDEWVWENAPAPTIQSVLPDPADNGTVVSVNASYTPLTGSGPLTYSWLYYGDGVSSYSTNPNTNTSTALSFTSNHTYSSPGVYAATIVEYDFFTLNGSSPAVNVTVNPSLAGMVHANPTTVDPGQSVAFSATVGNGTTPYNLSWNFGDGSTPVFGTSPSHLYASSGTFHVHLTITDAGGGSLVLTKSVTVNPTLTTTAVALPASTTVGHAVNFTTAASGGSGSYSYVWEFGDGSVRSTSQNPSHTYAAAGTYAATVWANDSLGESATKTVVVTVTTASSPPSPSGSGLSSRTWALILVIVVVAVLVALAAVLLMRRRKKSPPATPETWTTPSTTPPPPSAGGPPPGVFGPPPPEP